MDAEPAQRRRFLPADPAFRRLAQVQLAHAAGDALIAVSLANTLFFSVTATQARDKVALYLLLTMTPFAVLSPFVGPLLDRFRGSYRIAMIMSAAGRAALALWLSTRTDRLVLYPLAFGALVLSRAHGVSRAAMVPEVIPEGKTLVWGNAWLAGVSVVGAFMAGLPGAGINRLLGPGWTLKIAAVVFVLMVGFAMQLPKIEGGTRRGERVRDFKALLSARILAGGVATAAVRGGVGFLTFFLAFVLRSRGHAGAGFGAVVVAAAAGTALASLLAPVLKRLLHESAVLVIASLTTGLTAILVIQGFGLAKAALLAGVAGLGAGMSRLAFDSLLQTEAHEAIRGRTFARYETIFQLFWVGGAALATVIPFNPAYGLRTMAAISFAGVAASIWRFATHERTGEPA